MNLKKPLLFIVGLLSFAIPSLKSEIMFSTTRDLKEAIITDQILAASTKEDAELMAALFQRHAEFDEFKEFATKRDLIVLFTGTHIMIDRIEVNSGSYYYAASVLVHEKGSSRALWIDIFFLLHGCIAAD
jgi:hypothetical protein